jgi:hypothetical protein
VNLRGGREVAVIIVAAASCNLCFVACSLPDASKSNLRLVLMQNPREYNRYASEEMKKVCWDIPCKH